MKILDKDTAFRSPPPPHATYPHGMHIAAAIVAGGFVLAEVIGLIHILRRL